MLNLHKMTVEELRRLGCAVSIFCPDELRGSNQSAVELAMVDAGFTAIDALALYPDPEED